MASTTDRRPIALLLVRDGEQRIIGRVAADRPCDLAVVDRVLRVRLVVARRGWSLRLLDADDTLVELLELCGFGRDLIP